MSYIASRFAAVKPSASMAASQAAKALRSTGVDVIDLGLGEPDFATPAHVVEAMDRATKEGQTRYTAAAGTPALREAVAEKFRRENGLAYADDDIVVANGAKQIIFNALMATLNPGDEVILPAPYFVSYPEMVKLLGGVPVSLELGEPERALAIYGEHVQPSVSLGNAVNVVSDTASFLWRLQAYGHTVPDGLWQAAATYARPAFPNAGFAFADVHMALLAAATGDKDGVELRVSALMALMALVEEGTLRAGPVVPAICRAALAFAEGDYAGCVHILEPVAAEVARIGGSGAQRELVQDMLLLALMRSGESVRAGALLDRRLHRRPSPRDKAWHGQLTV